MSASKDKVTFLSVSASVILLSASIGLKRSHRKAHPLSRPSSQRGSSVKLDVSMTPTKRTSANVRSREKRKKAEASADSIEVLSRMRRNL
ncbi:hypothetical protein E5Q_06326 [Mixia osmundae IAM 14324]|uniref:Uncharacterized protein n=1 Tax=Mixia osmundae (strain CBS 9802 / IAM 14324 / JCM 22182 / KY 12970) TaxID=764103 RepID=G7E907_MIXOS|nr:hypothetical protein E5Q_06326 [Mixia osmundae IAM 14324]